MKISKRSNGSFLLKIGTTETTIAGTITIKQCWQLYERLLVALAIDYKIIENEIKKDLETTSTKKIKNKK